MSSKREEEKNEKIIRGLMKLPPNRRCINCNSLVPQYVCTNFWTFVCLICSGIHREFTHRVKSVSMAKFTSQEVDALQKGGNQRARELFLKSWDPQKQRLPENSNADKIREFIKNVYVEKRYAGEKSSSRPPRDSQNHGDETRRASSYHSYSQSPPYDFQYEERRYGKHAPVLSRKPGSDRTPYEGKFSSFLSPSRLSGANEGSYPRDSDYSVSSGGDPFRADVLSPSRRREIGSPSSDTSSHFSRTGLHNSDGNSINDGRKMGYPQRPTSSGSFESFGSLSFKSINSMGLQEVTSEPEQPPQNSIPATFNGLDLFSEPFAPKNVPSTTTTHNNPQFLEQSLGSPVDLFQQSSIPSMTMPSDQQNLPVLPKQHSVAHPKVENSELVMPNNGGWATFDMPQNSLPVGIETPIPSSESSFDVNKQGALNPFSLVQSYSTQNSMYHDPSASVNAIWHDGLHNVETTMHNVETTRNSSPLWNAFEDFTGQQPIKEVPNNSGRAAMLHASDANKAHEFGVHKALDTVGNVRTPNEIDISSSSVYSHFGMPVHDASTAIAVGVRSLATGLKSSNPFDLPCDAALESGSMFWDMSSLQAAIPNNHMPPPYVSDANGSWYPQSSVAPCAPSEATFDPPSGSFEFIVEHAPNTRISSVPQGPVAAAPIGGNPFA